MSNQAKNTVCLWYNRDAEEAARFYAKTFPNSSVDAVHLAPGDFPSGKQGDVLTVEFTVMGIPCLGLNGGPGVKHNWAFSFQVATADQAETDRYWNAIVENGGEENACGWCQDKWGLSWQITPIALDESDHRSRSCCRQARVRCDDDDEKDRRRCDRSRAARLKPRCSRHLATLTSVNGMPLGLLKRPSSNGLLAAAPPVAANGTLKLPLQPHPR